MWKGRPSCPDAWLSPGVLRQIAERSRSSGGNPRPGPPGEGSADELTAPRPRDRRTKPERADFFRSVVWPTGRGCLISADPTGRPLDIGVTSSASTSRPSRSRLSRPLNVSWSSLPDDEDQLGRYWPASDAWREISSATQSYSLSFPVSDPAYQRKTKERHERDIHASIEEDAKIKRKQCFND